MARVPQNRHRETVHVCPVPSCRRKWTTEFAPFQATKTLVDHGWQWSTQITEPDDTWHLVCPKHYKGPDSRTIFHDAETNMHRVELPLES